MRADRLLTMAVFQPLVRLAGPSAADGKLPILMYHSIAEDADVRCSPYYRTVTTPQSFARHMRCLAEAGYRGVKLSEAMLRWGTPGADSARTVAITFDDGFRDVCTTALPIMQMHGFSGTVFLSTQYIGSRFLTGRPCLSVQDIRSLSEQGIEFGSHTVTHPQLRTLVRKDIELEISLSKRRIEDILGAPIAAFSYPYRFPEEDASFVRELAAFLRAAGYTIGVTTRIGRAARGDDPLFLRRLPVNDCDDDDLFRAKLGGAYDWLHAAQLTVKRARALASLQ
jgi:peptidoglycan/xylan/chitin deacetylase (PgdA/CDA1 family)